MNSHYDIGVYGLWYGRNYGSILTYYALRSVLRELGYTVVFLDNPLSDPNVDSGRFAADHPYHFSHAEYEIALHRSLDQMGELNDLCDRFLAGSDQLWNYALSRKYGQTYFLDFADDIHPKIAYATSFGHYPYNGPAEDWELVRGNLARFQAISVRDSFSKQVIEEEFGLKAEKVLDPVFLCPEAAWDRLEEKSAGRPGGDYLLAYILNPSETIGRELQRIAQESETDLVVLFDEAGSAEEHAAALGVTDGRLHFSKHLSAYDWLAHFRGAKFVLTDSFHGICFSSVFHKDFIALQNKVRGPARFADLTQVLGFEDRLITSEDQFLTKYAHVCEQGLVIDWNAFETRIGRERDRSRAWLENALRME